MSKPVPNSFPTVNGQPYKIALVGEAPGEAEIEQGKPFVGASGSFLNGMLGGAGIIRDACFVGNVCQLRPLGNNINLFAKDGPEISRGIELLESDLTEFQPNLIVCLGGTALWWAKGSRLSIDDWRGSLFASRHGKAMGTIHPAACLREYSYTPMLRFDLQRAAKEGLSPDLHLPQRQFHCDLPIDETIYRLASIPDGATIAIDVEGYWNNLKMCSVALSPYECFLVDLQPNDADPIQERELWKTFARVMGNANIKKICQNALYELFVLDYGYRIPIRGLTDDTMLRHWEQYCEMPKALDFQASIYTREPFWKSSTMYETDRAALKHGCCVDSAVTYEINNVLATRVPKEGNYALNMNLLEPLLFMEKKGIRYDTEKARSRLAEVHRQEFRLQHALNEIAGITFPVSLLKECKSKFCFQRQVGNVKTFTDVLANTKTTCLHLATRALQIAKQEKLSLADKGELSILLDNHLNVDSKTQLPHYLYQVLGLPTQYKKEKGKLTDRPTTDVLALLTLFRKTQDPVIKLILTLRGLRTRTETLGCAIDPDNRIRCSYNVLKEESGKGGPTSTGRVSCSTSLTGAGYSLHTTSKPDKDLFLPDPGNFIFSCDLSGADGWSVAAHCKACGDPTMIDDLLYGLKPAKIIDLMRQHGRAVLSWSREKIREESRGVDPDGWQYFACKVVYHMSDYGGKPNTISDTIIKVSYKKTGIPIFVEPALCEELQRFFFLRYPGILSWHERVKYQLKKHGYITSPNGHKRIFFGRRDDYNTFKEACAEEPQNTTTFVTNTALWRMWSDPENRRLEDDNRQDDGKGMGGVPCPHQLGTVPGECLQRNQAPAQAAKPPPSVTQHGNSLRVQPLHQIHDALLGQFPCGEVAWSLRKIREWFNNPITVAGQTLTIPFEGAYGTSWGNLKEGTI